MTSPREVIREVDIQNAKTLLEEMPFVGELGGRLRNVLENASGLTVDELLIQLGLEIIDINTKPTEDSETATIEQNAIKYTIFLISSAFITAGIRNEIESLDSDQAQ